MKVDSLVGGVVVLLVVIEVVLIGVCVFLDDWDVDIISAVVVIKLRISDSLVANETGCVLVIGDTSSVGIMAEVMIDGTPSSCEGKVDSA